MTLAGNTTIDAPPPPAKGLSKTSKAEIARWWANTLGGRDNYDCYGTFLFLSGDKEIIRYLIEYEKELDVLSGKNCLILVLSKNYIKRIDGDRENVAFYPKLDWSKAVNEQATKGYSVDIGKILGYKATEFPCLILFNNIFSKNYTAISLKSLSAEGISNQLRQMFVEIDNAIEQKQKPLLTVQNLIKKGKLKEQIQKTMDGLVPVARFTLQQIIENLMKSL